MHIGSKKGCTLQIPAENIRAIIRHVAAELG
jgi:hypothetical protein